MKRSLLLLLATVGIPSLLPGQATEPEQDAAFSHAITTAKKPWTNRAFRNDPDDFQFVIVTDRTGGMRPGVFSRAVDRINQMQPEFVISVGDLIPGGGSLRDEGKIREQWDEFNALAAEFEMPFFYLPGNHDVSNPTGDRIWDELFGLRYYSFVYKDVLFLCLNTQDGEGTRPFLGSEQVAWAQDELAAHPAVRWTLVFLHQPLWLTEEKRGAKEGAAETPSITGWPEIEAALEGRKHTVYAGHVHRYARYERNEARYYTLGTTGGGSRLRGEVFGEFDHATWITLTDEGPRMLNLTLDGMLPDDVTTEAHHDFRSQLRFTESFPETYPFGDRELTLRLENPFEGAIEGTLSWLLPASDHWSAEPRRTSIRLEPGEQKKIRFMVSHRGEAPTIFPLPRLQSRFHGEANHFHLDLDIHLPLDLDAHLRKHPIRARVSATHKPPVIDGKLDEIAWQGAPTIEGLIPMKADGHSPVRTEAWLTRDDRSIYLGIRCQEPWPGDLVSEITARDGEVWLDDSIEILIDANLDRKSLHRFVVNASALLFDSYGDDESWNSSALVSTSTEENSWTIEMAIPLEEIGADLSAHDTWGVQVVRHRPRGEDRKSYQWAPTFWYDNNLPSLFGQLEFNTEN